MDPANHTQPTTPPDSPLRQRLRQRALEAADQLADSFEQTPDQQLFGTLEWKVRDLVHQLAADAYQTALQERKKGAIHPDSAPTARPTHDSSNTDPIAF